MKKNHYLALVAIALLTVLCQCNFSTEQAVPSDPENVVDSPKEDEVVNEVQQTIEYDVYVNPRFAYSVKYPTFLTSKIESDNGDGCTFSDENKSQMKVYAEYNVLGNSLDELESKFSNNIDGPVTSSMKDDNWFVLSGVNTEGNLYYQKVVLDEDTMYAVEYVCPQDQQERFDEVVKVVAESLQVNLESEVAK